MRWVILGELVVAALAGWGFVADYARSSSWRRTPAGRHIMAVGVVMAGEATTLALLGFHIPVPMPAFAVGFGAIDVVVVHRWLLLWRARRTPLPVSGPEVRQDHDE